MGCVQVNQKKESFPHQKTIAQYSNSNNPYLPEKETLRPLQHRVDIEAEIKPKQKQLIKRKSSLARLFQEHRSKRKNQKQTLHFKYISDQTDKTKDSKTHSLETPMKDNLEDHLQAVKKMIEQQGEDIITCAICTQEYDLFEREPIMVCINQHTFCRKCLKDLQNKELSKCPFDQESYNLKNVRKNRIICELLSKIRYFKE